MCSGGLREFSLEVAGGKAGRRAKSLLTRGLVINVLVSYQHLAFYLTVFSQMICV